MRNLTSETGFLELLDGRKNIFLAVAGIQFVAKGPAKSLKVCQWIMFLWPK